MKNFKITSNSAQIQFKFKDKPWLIQLNGIDYSHTGGGDASITLNRFKHSGGEVEIVEHHRIKVVDLIKLLQDSEASHD